MIVGHVDCPVYDDEPSSIISHCLSSVEHYNLVTKGMSWEEVVQSMSVPNPEETRPRGVSCSVDHFPYVFLFCPLSEAFFFFFLETFMKTRFKHISVTSFGVLMFMSVM